MVPKCKFCMYKLERVSCCLQLPDSDSHIYEGVATSTFALTFLGYNISVLASRVKNIFFELYR